MRVVRAEVSVCHAEMLELLSHRTHLCTLSVLYFLWCSIQGKSALCISQDSLGNATVTNNPESQ